MNKFSYFMKKLWEIKGTPQLIKDTISVSVALVSGETVSKEQIEKRIRICGMCEYISISTDGYMTCGICGCNVDARALLVNLALYEENLPLYGCKFPSGSKWKTAGV